MREYIFTSESVSSGHPDKLCDQVSDAIVDLYLAQNPKAKVAVETMATPSKLIIAGEVRDGGKVNNEIIENLARKVIRDIGYEQELFHWNTINIETLIHAQSPDIAMGVDAGNNKEEGAGDQGIMFGFACDETEHLMPATIYYSHRILQNIEEAIRRGEIKGLGPDAKSQVSLFYQNGRPLRATSVLVSIQHKAYLSQEQIKSLIRPYVIASFPNQDWMCDDSEFYVNPTGLFTIGGPEGDTGLTGRKIIVDTYGGAAPHGGGAFSGKDPSKVDRSAAYMARYVAKNIVAAGIAKKCTIQIAYAIGMAHPLSFYVNTHNTSSVPDNFLAAALPKIVNFTPAAIKSTLQLNKPIYFKTATYGHFGRPAEMDGHFSWEKLDLVDEFRSKLLK